MFTTESCCARMAFCFQGPYIYVRSSVVKDYTFDHRLTRYDIDTPTPVGHDDSKERFVKGVNEWVCGRASLVPFSLEWKLGVDIPWGIAEGVWFLVYGLGWIPAAQWKSLMELIGRYSTIRYAFSHLLKGVCLFGLSCAKARGIVGVCGLGDVMAKQ